MSVLKTASWFDHAMTRVQLENCHTPIPSRHLDFEVDGMWYVGEKEPDELRKRPKDFMAKPRHSSFQKLHFGPMSSHEVNVTVYRHGCDPPAP